MVSPVRIVPGSDFVPLWVLLTALGYVIGFFAGFVLGHMVLGNVAIGIGLGAVTGAFQWLVLRRYIQGSGLWMVASVIGLFVGLGLYAIMALVWNAPFDLGWPIGALGYILAFLIGGLLIGLIQRSVLRRYVSHADRWVLISEIGWAASVLGLAIPSNMFGHSPLAVLAAAAIGGIILGLVTGFGLRSLFREPKEQFAE
jgi:hypothetical protein